MSVWMMNGLVDYKLQVDSGMDGQRVVVLYTPPGLF